MYGTDYDEVPNVDPWAPEAPTPAPAWRLVAGGSFIHDAPTDVPAVWGNGDGVLWARGESLIIAGPSGVGKTTLAGQLVRARILGGSVLGYDVAPGARRVLYLAMDRPQQTQRALRRTLGDIAPDVLDDRLIAWQGPPPYDVAKRPSILAALALEAEADTVIVDSLKDAAIGLSDDEVGAGYNRARQAAIAEGIELVELHHLVKRGPNGARPSSLPDLYGSVWLSAGSGSVVMLWGEPGDPIVDFRHLKQPAEEVGPFRVIHDHDRGVSDIWHQGDILAAIKAAGPAGMTAKAAAVVLFETDKPSPSQVEKARRRLSALTRDGADLTFTEGDKATSTPARWTFTAPFTPPLEREPLHDPADPSRLSTDDPFTPPFTTITPPPLHAHPPVYKTGVSEGEGPSGCHLHPETPRPDACHTCESIAAGVVP